MCVCVCVQLPAANAQVSVLKEKGEEDTDGHEQKVPCKRSVEKVSDRAALKLEKRT